VSIRGWILLYALLRLFVSFCARFQSLWLRLRRAVTFAGFCSKLSLCAVGLAKVESSRNFASFPFSALRLRLTIGNLRLRLAEACKGDVHYAFNEDDLIIPQFPEFVFAPFPGQGPVVLPDERMGSNRSIDSRQFVPIRG